MADISINRYTSHDGRRAEQRITEKQVDAGHKERVVETLVEQIPLSLEERVVETIVPIVTERRKEKWQDGKLVDTFIEQVADESLHLTEQPKATVTKEDVREAVKLAFRELGANHPVVHPPQQQRVTRHVAEETEVIPQQPVVAPPVVTPPAVVTPPTTTTLWYSEWFDLGLYVVLSGELAFIVYQLFIRGLIER